MSTAEEYYSRAILADPKDGEVLSQYANVVWEIHHDQDRASSYFKRAVHASPADRFVYQILSILYASHFQPITSDF